MASAPQSQLDRRPSFYHRRRFHADFFDYIGDGSIFPAARQGLQVWPSSRRETFSGVLCRRF